MNIVTKIRLLHALVKVTRNRKREIAMLLQDSRFSICSVTLQMVSTCKDVGSNMREEMFGIFLRRTYWPWWGL